MWTHSRSYCVDARGRSVRASERETVTLCGLDDLALEVTSVWSSRAISWRCWSRRAMPKKEKAPKASKKKEAAEEPAEKEPTKWTCEDCGMEHEGDDVAATECVACGAPKPVVEATTAEDDDDKYKGFKCGLVTGLEAITLGSPSGPLARSPGVGL